LLRFARRDQRERSSRGGSSFIAPISVPGCGCGIARPLSRQPVAGHSNAVYTDRRGHAFFPEYQQVEVAAEAIDQPAVTQRCIKHRPARSRPPGPVIVLVGRVDG